MAIEVGDLWPQVSGSSSLGSEFSNGEFTGEIRPFAHVHFNSGVFHHILGNSGIIRMQNTKDAVAAGGNAANQFFGFSFDGGLTFPLEFGKNTAGVQGVLMAVPTGNLQTRTGDGIAFVTLNNAASIGFSTVGSSAHITFGTSTSDSYVQMDSLQYILPIASGKAYLGLKPIVIPPVLSPFASINMNSGVFHGPYGNSGVISFGQGASTVASGISAFLFSMDGGNTNPFRIVNNQTNAITWIENPIGILRVVGSGGLALIAENAKGLTVTAGQENVSIAGIYSETIGGAKFSTVDSTSTTSTNDARVTSVNGQVYFETQNTANGLMNLNSVSDVLIETFNHSGILSYRFGPYQSWNIKPGINTGGPLNDGFWPIAHSGNVNEMINKNVDFTIAPAASGVSSLGFDNGSPRIRPYADIHQNSGVFHAPYGASGIIRFRQLLNVDGLVDDGFDFSADGGANYHVRIAGGGTSYGIIETEGTKQLLVRGSGIQMNTIGDLLVSARRQTGVSPMLGKIDVSAFSDWNANVSNINFFARNSITLGPSNKTILGANGSDAPVNMSGLFAFPSTNNLIGDMYMMSHSVISGIIPATTSAIAKAQALGVGTLALNTGSGIANISIGSGIAQFYNNTTQQLNTVLANVAIDTCVESADTNYGVGSIANNTSGVITVFSPGLYKISYKVSATKTIGASSQFCNYRLEKNASGSAIIGSSCNTIHISNTVSDCSTSNVILINLDPGDTISMRANSSSSGANNCSINSRGALIVIEKIGPKRGAAGS